MTTPEVKTVSHLDIRVKALELAVSTAPPNEAARLAEEFYQFLMLAIPADQRSSSSASTTTKTAKKATKAASESPPAAAPSSTSAEPTSVESPSEKAAPVKESAATGTSPASSTPIPTLDDVRYALTQCQARNGGDIAKPRDILSKYAKTGTLGSLSEADRAKVIEECKAA